MRLLSAAGLFALVAAAAGCGPSGGPVEPAAPTPEPHDKGANDARQTLPQRYTDAAGRPVDLAAFRGRPVVLVVVKGFSPKFNGFCPGCVAQVTALAANHDEFKKRSAEVLLLFPGNPDTLGPYLEKGRVDGQGGNPKVPFPVLLDPDLAAVKALGIESELAKQSTFILDREGRVVFGYVGNIADTYDRPSVKAVLARLDKLNDKK